MPPKILNISEIKWMLILSEYFEIHTCKIKLEHCGMKFKMNLEFILANP